MAEILVAAITALSFGLWLGARLRDYQWHKASVSGLRMRSRGRLYVVTEDALGRQGIDITRGGING